MTQTHLWGQLQAILLLSLECKALGTAYPVVPVGKVFRLHKVVLKIPFIGANARQRKKTGNFTSLEVLGTSSCAAPERPLCSEHGMRYHGVLSVARFADILVWRPFTEFS